MIVSGAMMRLHVKEVAEAKGITSAKMLSERSNIPYASVHRIWNGSVTMLALDTIERLCRALNVQPGMLMSWIETEDDTGPPTRGHSAQTDRPATASKPRRTPRSKISSRAAIVTG